MNLKQHELVVSYSQIFKEFLFLSYQDSFTVRELEQYIRSTFKDRVDFKTFCGYLTVIPLNGNHIPFLMKCEIQSSRLVNFFMTLARPVDDPLSVVTYVSDDDNKFRLDLKRSFREIAENFDKDKLASFDLQAVLKERSDKYSQWG